ncbi:MAG: UvrD-helicase domain-containing protein [Verrucomicrobiales bacterium]
MRLSELNEPQQQAARQIHGPVLILAGAGTGKTRVITTRIAHLMAKGIMPEKILAVTFTNKAAAEMRERLAKVVPKKRATKATLCTFHSLCVRILRKDIERLGYKRNFTIYAQSDQVGLVRKILARKGTSKDKMDPNMALGIIGKAKNVGAGPEFHDEGSLMRDVHEAYQSALKLQNAVDFDDLLLLAVRVLEQFPAVRTDWASTYSHIMVDEFQDTNNLQMRMLRALGDDHQNVCVVGDDDQSIYGWRGAEISNILDFEAFFPNPTVVKLEQNYRSTTPILHTANSLIRHNRDRRPKTLWSDNPGEEMVRLIGIPDDRQEAEFVVNEIWEQKNVKGLPWEDFAVLFRTNMQSRLFEQSFRAAKIPYRIVGGQSFFDRREVKDLLAYLTLLVNPEDDSALLRIVNTPPRGISDATVSLATEESIHRQSPVANVLMATDFQENLSSRAATAVNAFATLIGNFRYTLSQDPHRYAELTSALIEEIDYVAYIKRVCKTGEEANKREEAIWEFLESMRAHQRGTGKRTLEAFLDEIALASDRDDDDDVSKKKGVCLITLHASKGLEFPEVYLIGLEEGILPHKRSIEEQSSDEERRLLYVGITRAMRRLTISYCISRIKYGDLSPCMPSSFLAELDRLYLESISYEEVMQQPVTQDSAAASFSAMRALISGDSRD